MLAHQPATAYRVVLCTQAGLRPGGIVLVNAPWKTFEEVEKHMHPMTRARIAQLRPKVGVLFNWVVGLEGTLSPLGGLGGWMEVVRHDKRGVVVEGAVLAGSTERNRPVALLLPCPARLYNCTA